MSLHLPKLNRHFHGCLNGGGPIVAEKDPFQCPFGKKARKSRSQLDCFRIGRAEKGDMRHAVELVANRAIDCWMRVAMDVCPNRGVAVQVAAALAVLQPTALASHQDKRRVVFRAPFLHRCEGVPKVLLVALDQ